MNVDRIKEILSKNNKVSFKLYSMDYIIELENNMLILYSPTYPNDKRRYKDINALLSNFKVYNETLIEVDSRIENIE